MLDVLLILLHNEAVEDDMPGYVRHHPCLKHYVI